MKTTILLLLCSLSAHAQIIFQIGDKRAEIVPTVTYDTAVCLSLNQMDNIMIELLKCDSIAEVAKISDLQLSKYKSIVDMQSDQISTVKAALNTSNNFNKALQIDVRTLTAENETTKRKLTRNRKAFFATALVAVVELVLIL